MKYLIVDDLKFNFFKIAPLRSQLDIRVGILKLRQKLEGYLGIEEVSLIIDGNLEELYQERYKDKIINIVPEGQVCYVNGRVKIDEHLAEIISQQELDSVLTGKSGEFISIKINNAQSQVCDSHDFLKLDFTSLKKLQTQYDLWDSLEEIIISTGACIKQDYTDFFYEKDNYSETEQGVTIINPYDVWIGQGASLKHGAVLDASQGAIVIDEGACVGINSTIEGPAYIGKETLLQASTNIRGGTSIGKNCNVGGEIVACVFQGFSTKPFRGTLHKCYVGEWTKFEAGISIESDFFDSSGVTKIRDYSLSFSFNNSTDENICQYQEMRKTKLEIMKFDKNIEFSKIEHNLLKKYLNEEIYD